MLRDQKGRRLYRRIEVKVIFPEDTFSTQRFVSKAGLGKAFNSEGVDDILMQVATRLEELYPWWEFRMIELASPARVIRFVFKQEGYNTNYKLPVAQADLKDFTLPENSSLEAI